MKQRYFIVDVFAEKAFAGAQIAVFPDAEGYTDPIMQTLAAELSVTETVFVTGCDDGQYRIRVFSPFQEVNLGSHTTLAAARVMAYTGQLATGNGQRAAVFGNRGGQRDVYLGGADGSENFVQFSQCTHPQVENYVPSLAEWGDILGLSPRQLDVKDWRPLLVANQGLYLIVPASSFVAVREAHFQVQAWNQSSAPSTTAQQILLFSVGGQATVTDFHLRLLGPSIGPQDDLPVGAAVPAFAAYLCAHKQVKQGTHSFLLERGLAERRQSRLHVEMDHRATDSLTVRVGGNAIVVGEGVMRAL